MPRKNILPFRGRPMIAWTIEAARSSDIFDDIVVTTDDQEIATLAKSAGVTVLDRPAVLANDEARLVDVLRHTLPATRRLHDLFCLLLPNCPLRGADHIRHSFDVMREGEPSALLSVVRYGWTPAVRAMRRGAIGLEPVFPHLYKAKSQSFPDLLCPSGAIYWAKTSGFMQTGEIYAPGLQPYIMPWHAGIDIDDLADLRLAEALAWALEQGFPLQ